MANWQPFERRPTWSVVSSRELSMALEVSLQTINNWKMRGLIKPEQSSRYLPAGNRNYYRISKIRSWLENKTEDEIHWEWVHKWLVPRTPGIERLAQAETLVKSIPDHYGVEKSILPGDFAVPVPIGDRDSIP